MSSISKLQIRGIRSFSPDRDETIEFYSPLTMIVGANGCGKTTIIESLKFATTGSLPPNCKNGQSFVNDPSMTDSTEVKAHIKLRFTNRSDATCVAVRSLQVIKKKSKLEYKGLENVLRTTNAQGEKLSISMKCIDMDKIIPENLGVSPAIIEHVIFVHQEDSNWPMQEGMVLKKRFDEVFESTRYTKALEAFTKAKKEYQSKSKDLKGELMEFGAHLVAANQARRDFTACEENKEESKAQLEDILRHLEDNEAQLNSSNEALAKASRAAAELTELNRSWTDMNAREQDKIRSLDRVLDGESDAQLRGTLSNFETVMINRTNELREMQRSIDTLHGQISQLRSKNDTVNIQMGKAQSLQEQCRAIREQLSEVCTQTGRKYNISGNDAQHFLVQINKEYQRVQDEVADIMTAARNALSIQEKDLHAAQSKVQQVDVELRLTREEGDRLRAQSDTRRGELGRMVSSRTNISTCQTDYDAALQSHDEFQSTYNTKSAELKDKLRETSDEMRVLQDTLAADAQLLQDMSLRRNELAAVDASIKVVDQELVQIEVGLRNAYRSNKTVLLTVGATEDPPVDVTTLDTAITLLNNTASVHQATHTKQSADLKQSQAAVAAGEAVLNGERTRLGQMKGKLAPLQAYDNKVQAMAVKFNALLQDPLFDGDKTVLNVSTPGSGDCTIESLVARAEIADKDIRESYVLAKAAKGYKKRLMDMQKEANGACPCCNQSMTAAVRALFEDNMGSKIFPETMTKEQQAAKKAVVAKYADLLAEAKAVENELGPLLEIQREVAAIEGHVVELVEDVQSKRADVTAAEEGVAVAAAELKVFNSLIQTLSDISSHWKAASARKSEFSDKRRRQVQGSSFMSQSQQGGGPQYSMEELEQRQRDNTERKDELQMKKDRLTAEESNLVKRMYAVKSRLGEQERLLNEAKLAGTRHSELESQVSELSKRIQALDTQRMDLQRSRDALSADASSLTLKVNRLRADVTHQADSGEARAKAVRQDRDAVSKLSESLADTEKRLAECDLAALQRSAVDIQDSTRTKEEELRTLTPKASALSAELAGQEQTRRNVLGNLDLRELRQQMKSMKERLDAAASGTGAGSNADIEKRIRRAQREVQDIQNTHASLCSDRDVLRGKLEIYNQQMIDLKAKLSSPLYKGIEERHRRKTIEYETTVMAVSDLDCYYNALDKALQNFHVLKIREINKIIRELWQLVYKGQDIDTIEIESGQEGAATAAAAGAKGSRSYNYRVVMRKGGCPLDMRGRCSAGQKVLAAVVIRLALAETFCLNFGMLALDEPTTNLDEANRAGLAHALARIIMSRTKQQNFQLICITHDEEFVRLMSTELAAGSGGEYSGLPEFYFRISRVEEAEREGKFFSRIERVPWEDL